VDQPRDLKRTILNGTGIVVSILLAFAIEAGWNARSERQGERAALEGLRAEFGADLRQLDEMIAEFRRQDSLLERFFALSTPESEDVAEEEVGRFNLALMWADIFDPSTGTLETLLSSGRLDLISDPDLRRLLFVWKRQVEDTEDDTEAFTHIIQQARPILGRLGARGIRRDLRPTWREQFDRIRSSQDLSAIGQSALTDRRIYRLELQALRETTALVLGALD
jgi:hypothetical protein